jgi:hypothetical protein
VIFPWSARLGGTTVKADTAFLQPKQLRGIFASQPKGENVRGLPLNLDYSKSSDYYPLLGGS